MKNFLGYLLVVSAFVLIAALAFPVLFDGQKAGRTDKKESVNLSFLDKESAPTVLVYFGYVGCTRVCEPALRDIARMYTQHIEANPSKKPAVWFVNMTTEVDSQSASAWASYFHPDFKSHAPSKEGLATIVQKLGLIYSDLGLKAEHAPYLYLFRKTDSGYELQYIYTTRPYNERLVLENLRSLN